jgi:hypothetical protein
VANPRAGRAGGSMQAAHGQEGDDGQETPHAGD